MSRWFSGCNYQAKIVSSALAATIVGVDVSSAQESDWYVYRYEGKFVQGASGGPVVAPLHLTSEDDHSHWDEFAQFAQSTVVQSTSAFASASLPSASANTPSSLSSSSQTKSLKDPRLHRR